MFARVTTAQVPPEKLDIGEAATRQAAAKMREQPGSSGALLLVDREHAKLIAVTLWEDQDALRASEEVGSTERHQAAQASSGQVLDVELYEVLELQIGRDMRA